MKQAFAALLLAGALALSLSACGENQGTVSGASSGSANGSGAGSSSQASASGSSEREDFSFADLKNLEFTFSSGAGAWSTQLLIREDGSFSGEYADSDMGDIGDGYPGGTQYRCDFTGQFGELTAVNDYTCATTIEQITCEQEPETQEIKNGTLYRYSEPYGLEDAERILIYLPGAPIAELPQEFRNWVGCGNSEETALPFCGLYNEAQQEGFSSGNVIDNLKERISGTEDYVSSLGLDLQKDSGLTQTEMNNLTYQQWRAWDICLNDVWGVLTQILDADTTQNLTAEELDWIASRDRAADEAAAQYDGGSLEDLAYYQTAADMTKARVYELMDLLETQ